MGTVTMEAAMFILILILILLLPVAALPLVLGTFYSSGELMDMGVYVENAQSIPTPARDPINGPQSGSLRPFECLFT
jgi:hypothetical protein